MNFSARGMIKINPVGIEVSKGRRTIGLSFFSRYLLLRVDGIEVMVPPTDEGAAFVQQIVNGSISDDLMRFLKVISRFRGQSQLNWVQKLIDGGRISDLIKRAEMYIKIVEKRDIPKDIDEAILAVMDRREYLFKNDVAFCVGIKEVYELTFVVLFSHYYSYYISRVLVMSPTEIYDYEIDRWLDRYHLWKYLKTRDPRHLDHVNKRITPLHGIDAKIKIICNVLQESRPDIATRITMHCLFAT